MTKAGMLMFAAVLLAAAPAAAQGKKAKVKVSVEIEIEFEEMQAVSELPTTVDEAADAGSTETEINKAFDALKLNKIKGKPAKAIGIHFKEQASKDLSDEGLGDIVKDCIDKGHKGEDLVNCVTGAVKNQPKDDKEHPVVKAKPMDAATPPVAVKVQPAALTPPAKADEEHKAVSTGVGATKKKGALKK